MGSQCLRTGRFGRSTSTTRSPQACRARGVGAGEVEQCAVAGGVQ